MAVLDWITPDPGLVLEGESVRLRAPRMGDYAAWAELRHESRAFLQDGDEVIFRAFARREGFVAISFGECRGVIQPA